MTYLCPAAPACDFVSEYEYDIDDHVVHCEGFRGVAFARPGSTVTVGDKRLWDLPEPEESPELLITRLADTAST
jgi:hypothetical protein